MPRPTATPASIPTPAPTPTPASTRPAPPPVPQEQPTLDFPWTKGNLSADESQTLRNFTEIALKDPALARNIAGFRWLADGITPVERAVLLDLWIMAVLEGQTAEAGRIVGLAWLRDDIASRDGSTSEELGAVRLLRDLYRKDPSLADGFIGLSWVADGISPTEFGAFREIGVILNADVSQVRLLAETPWFADGISPEELQPLSSIARLSAGGVTSAESREISAILAAGVPGVSAAATPVPTRAPALTATPEPTLPPPRFGELYRAVEAIAPIELIEQVIDRGADINEVVELGETPLHVAAAATYIPAVRLLLERGADVDPRNIDGSTPLVRYLSTPDPDPDVVALFLDYGSDVNAKDNNGETPLYYAEARSLDQIAALLRSKGARTGQEAPVKSPTPQPTAEAEDQPEVEAPDPNAKENHDADGDGLIEIHYLEQLSAIRYDPDGDGVPLDTNDLDGDGTDDFQEVWWGTSAQLYAEAFPATPGGAVCGTGSGCTGYELARSLDFEDPDSYLAPSASGTGWEPILVCHGYASGCSRKVTLTFDGNGHTISNLTARGWGPSGLSGLFFRIDGIIRNVGLLDVDVENRAGPLAALNYGVITNSYVTGNARAVSSRITRSVQASGFVLQNYGTISRSYASVDVSWPPGTNKQVSGGGEGDGLAGFAWVNEGVIEDSYATGDASGLYGAGLAFRNHGIIRDSYATGDVNGGGGLVSLNLGTIDNSYATGDVDGGGGLARMNGCWGTASPYVEGGTLIETRGEYRTICGLISNSHATGNVLGAGGGLVGENAGGIIRNCYATGNISGRGGGLVGVNWIGRNAVPRDDFHDTGIFFSYATGNVNGGGGGLVWLNRGSIIASYATGNVIGAGVDEYSGGLVGKNLANPGLFFDDSGTIIASYATGNVSGSGYLGGLSGLEGSYVYASYSTGRVSGEGNVGGFSGYAGLLVYDNYWDTLSSGTSAGVGGGRASKHGNTSELGIEGKTTEELQSPTGYTGIYADWNTDAHISELELRSGSLTGRILAAWKAGRDNSDPSTRLSDFWDFGDGTTYPRLKADWDGDGVATWQEFGPQHGQR